MVLVEANRRDFLRWLAAAGAGLATAGIAPAVFAQEAAAAGSEPVVALGATLVDGTDGPPLPDSAVVLVGDRIAWTGPAAHLPPLTGVRTVDGRGRYLVPGLWDLHTHGLDLEAIFPPLYLANGVTGIREMWGYTENRAARDKIVRGELAGPRVVMGSSIIDGPVSMLQPPVTKVATAADGRAAVRTALAEGADFVKVYSYLGAEAFAAIADECRRAGLPVAGHWPYRVPQPVASDAGQRSFEHLFGVPVYTSAHRDEFLRTLAATPFDPANPRSFFVMARELDRRATEAYSPWRAHEFFARLVGNETRLTPTMVVNKVMCSPADTFAHDPRLKYIPRDVRDGWAEQVRIRTPVTPEEIAQQAAYFHAQVELAGAAHRAGVPLLAGTDCLNPYVFPGFSLHDELAHLVDAGLSPRRALQVATRDAAAFLGRSATAGTISPGKVADLVLLDANPLSDIRAVRRIDTVVAAGRVYGRAALDRLLADVEAATSAGANARSVGLPVHSCC
ncbi:amidohydrolase family protein [Amycolatopsis sp. NPDC101161]|uniref:amidohydrolase family protein n=1 Tax=Amycolatopsis sp. NPDC101161 TaxID=3363940 RepID=UPI0038004BBA